MAELTGVNEEEHNQDSVIAPVNYSPEVEAAIQEVFLSTDELDSAEFSLVDYINSQFRTEQDLSTIDDKIGKIRLRIRTLDEEIRNIVHGQTTGHDGKAALEEAYKTIELLFGRIKSISEKAERSEQTVKEITRDIKQLDHCKQNLTSSIRTLEQLRMLMFSLDDLELNASQRKYDMVADQLTAVLTVVQSLHKYNNIGHIKQLESRVARVQDNLGRQIMRDFEEAFVTAGAKPSTTAILRGACKVVAILESSNNKEQLIKWFVDLQLSDYKVAFHDSEEASWLDKVDRRYAWLKRLLLNLSTNCPEIFPPLWGIPERIAINFCSQTKSALSAMMVTRSSELEVKLLLFAIQKTTTFEKTLAQHFSGSSYLETLQPRRTNSSHDDEDVIRRGKDDSIFLGMISRCFEPHLNVYITSQDRNLQDLLEDFLLDFKTKGPPKASSDGGTVFPTSADLFVFYKKCLVQCASLSTGAALLDLCTVFKKYLKEYCNKLLASNMPKLQQSKSMAGRLQQFGGLLKDTEAQLSPEEICLACAIISTADYCVETTEQLESKMQEKIDEELSSKVDFSQEKDLFHSVISSGVQLLVANLESGCDAALVTMTKFAWQHIETVGDQSSYVDTIASRIRITIPLIRENLISARKYFTNFCHKFANSFIPSFITHLYKCKPITTPVAAEQLLLDTHSLKTILLGLPAVSAGLERKPPLSYTKLVSKGMEKAELIIKVVMTPHERAADFVASYLKITEQDLDVSNFQRVLEMKGLKRSEQQALMELFKSSASRSGKMTTQSDQESSTIRKLERLIRIKPQV
ncbi:vacuolar protein sorting-associated protein 53 homolog [Dysidea avara]|uniref:vacuolar protein sorting-associated protein 53 homolog n=1 Tax=Dysidea avara TaxID=196820 RepID=UPI00332A42BC